MPLREPEARRAYHRKWSAEWRKKNPEKNRERGRRYDKKRASTPSRRLSAAKNYARHRAARLTYAKNRRAQHPEIYTAWCQQNRKLISRKHREYLSKRNAEKLALVEEIKRGPCLDCNRTFNPVCFDFDHRIPEDKKFTISDAVLNCRVGVETFKAEIEKCDLVCACCHRIRTDARRKAGVPCE